MTGTKVIASLGLLVLYSLSIHLGLLAGHTLPALLVLGIVFSIAILHKGYWPLLPLIPLILYLLWSSQAAVAFFLLPPVLINLLLTLVFGSTLLPGATPLITQFSQILKGDLDSKALRYTRQVTIAWVLFFALMSIEALLLAFYASPFIWSLFTNFLNYLFLIAFFLVEYRLRIRRFTEVEHPGFINFMRSLTKVDPKCIKTF
jgi:uncharacterized membrane protein